MLTGVFEHQTDERGRIVIPKTWREELEDGAYVTCGWYDCLWLFTMKKWYELSEILDKIPQTNLIGDKIAQVVGSGEKVKLDNQGRLLIPDHLLKLAGIGLKKDVVLSGAIRRADIWAKQTYQAHRDSLFTLDQRIELAGKAKEAELIF